MNAIQYEVLNKETSETFPVTKMEFFSQEMNRVDVSFGDEVAIFERDASGSLHNEYFAIREVGTNAQSDGTGTVDNQGNDVA